MAHHVVDRNAARMRIAAVAQRGRDRPAVECHLSHQVVDGGGGNAGADVRSHLVEDFGGQAPGLAHALEPAGAVELDGAIAQQDVAIVHDHVFGH